MPKNSSEIAWNYWSKIFKLVQIFCLFQRSVDFQMFWRWRPKLWIHEEEECFWLGSIRHACWTLLVTIIRGLDVELDLCLQCVSQLCKSEQDLIIVVSWGVWAQVCSVKVLGVLRFSLVVYRSVGIEPQSLSETIPSDTIGLSEVSAVMVKFLHVKKPVLL